MLDLFFTSLTLSLSLSLEHTQIHTWVARSKKLKRPNLARGSFKKGKIFKKEKKAIFSSKIC
jgi:hypothetical protein